MDLKQIEYIVKIDEEHSITHAAEKLFITQSALNQQLLKLEKELGAQLFHRTKSDWRPTAVGHVYLDNAREILRIRQNTYNIISDMTESKQGYLSVAFTPGRGSEMFTHVYPAFHNVCPNVIIEPHELSVHKQQQMISKGDLNLGFQTLSESGRTNDEYIKLYSEEIFLVIPSVHPAAQMAAPEGAPPSVIDLSLLKHEPFVLMYKESTIRSITDDIFSKSGFVPNVLFETSSNNTVIAMIQARLCCGVVPYHYIKHMPDGVCCFALPDHPSWDVVASHRKNAYLSKAAKIFIELAKDFWLPPAYGRNT